MTFVQVLNSLAMTRECPLYQLDVKNTFSHGDLNEEVYMEPPQGLPQPPIE